MNKHNDFTENLQHHQEMMKRATTTIIRALLAARASGDLQHHQEMMKRATTTIIRALLAARASGDLQHHQEMMKRATTTIIRASLAAQSQMDATISALLATQSKILKLQSYSGATIDGVARFQDRLRLNLDKFTTSNKSFNFIGHQPPTIEALEPDIIQHPSLEVFRETDLSEKTTVSAISTGSSLEKLLEEINPDLLNPLQGARQALHTNNPDRVRHIAASLRELIGHVCRQLAPDDIRAWNTNPDYYDDKGKPTRKARLLYICREIDSGPLSKLVGREVSSILTLIDGLNGGTHGVAPRFTDRQLQAIVDYTESHLLFLLRLASSNKS